ncbi:MAG: glycosyltransferase family 4 protein [Cytophagales bacterium]|nr:glycosyltransferase family 4 protein [Cytophagales bacterium]
MHNQKTILATAYAIDPYKGSEDGMGWNFIYQIARYNRVVAVTRKNNRANIQKYMQGNPDVAYEKIEFLYFDLPYWKRFWKQKERGAMLYYWMWQKAVPAFIKRQNIAFDIAHNLNFHNDWTPSYLWKLGKPFVWGPVGHHPPIPVQYLKKYRKSYEIKDRLRWQVKKYCWKYSASLRNTAVKADHILSMNGSVPQVLGIAKGKYTTMPSVATSDFGYRRSKSDKKFTLVSAGRLVPLKGFDLSISAFASFIAGTDHRERERCELLIIGSGPEEPFLRRLAVDLDVDQYVRFIRWMERGELMKLLKASSVFIFPSHEGAGMIVAEALSFGMPVICLDNCGPGEFIDHTCGIKVPVQGYGPTVEKLGKSITRLFRNPVLLKKLSRSARCRFETHFDWNMRGDILQTIYQKITA